MRYGGSLSGEHGDGQSRGALLPKMFGPELMEAFREFKAIWDPGNRLNPHKLVDAYLPTENLRLGADYSPAQPATYFTFPDDEGSFAKATMRCIGMGECRKHDCGTMCPSYMATLEERTARAAARGCCWRCCRARCFDGRLEERAGEGGARPVPVVQGLQVRVPDERRHGDLPGRVPLALLRDAAAAAPRVRVRPDRPVAALGSVTPRAGQFR